MKQKLVAFDLGGVLAYQDFTCLTEEEQLLFHAYMHRNMEENLELLNYAKQRIQEIYLKIHKPTPYAIPTLEFLKQEKIRATLWTNNIKEIEAWFELIGLYQYISYENIVNSFYLGFNKPDLQFYRSALGLLKALPQDVCFFDDSNLNVRSARACGIHARKYQMDEDLKHVVIKELEKSL